MEQTYFDPILGLGCSALFLTFGIVFRYYLLPWLFSNLSGSLDISLVKLVKPNSSLKCPLERWWAYSCDFVGAKNVSQGTVDEMKLCILDHNSLPKDVDKMRVEVAREIILTTIELRNEATGEYFRRKKQGLAEAAGQQPARKFVLGWSGWWLELEKNEKTLVTGMFFMSLYHMTTVICGVTKYVILGSHLTWASNVGDLLITITKPASNFNGARRVDQLILHHLMSIFLIPMFLYCNLPPSLMTRYLLILEVTGGLSSLLGSLEYTPFSSSKLQFWSVLSFVMIMFYQRVIEWSSLSYDVLIWANESYGSGFFFVILAFTGLFTYFNWFMIEAWWKRLHSVMENSDYKKYMAAVDYPVPHILYDMIVKLIAWPLSPIVLFGWPVAFVLYNKSVISFSLFVVLYSSVLPIMIYRFSLFFKSFGHLKTTRREFNSYAECKKILSLPIFSPTPYRYRHPKPVMKPFADWVRAMLLYNDEGHMRLKHSYPKLNQVKHVHTYYDELIKKSIQDLLQESIKNKKLTSGKSGTIDLMKDVCVQLPWIIMRHITGMPIEDVPRASDLIRDMGDFVGKPFDSTLMKKAAGAQRDMVFLIKKWVDDFQVKYSGIDSVNLEDSVFPFWIYHNVFPSASEFEANVVMLLFAGTHNLENVLGHAVRLLLQHPNELAKLKSDPKLLVNAVDEILRYCPAIRIIPRTALGNVELEDGTRIKEGETVLLKIFEANRDTNVHVNPDIFDITRPKTHKHLTFGYGTHLCSGNQLGKLQMRRLLELLLLDDTIFKNVSLTYPDENLDWVHTYSHLEHLYLDVTVS
eukprot:TRINITY_DN2641_c0_g2_i2.p1 TRINITY_DN2641_c0_g2~~TRINITY_DN2641_c0_g2_i2.p1  ORF type:complete len:807 (+),score=100.63 TRINITY_DN2641_c0_g2_i2:2127-4547(+)